MYIYIYVDIYQETACTARTCFTGVFLLGTAVHVASKETHSTALHEPTGKAAMHGFARKTCRWIPSFTDLHDTAWNAPVHMDLNLGPLMEFNSARRCPWQA